MPSKKPRRFSGEFILFPLQGKYVPALLTSEASQAEVVQRIENGDKLVIYGRNSGDIIFSGKADLIEVRTKTQIVLVHRSFNLDDWLALFNPNRPYWAVLTKKQ